MGVLPSAAARHEVGRDQLDLDVFGQWLMAAIVRAVRVPQAQLQTLCDAVVAMVLSVVDGDAERVAVEVEQDGGCLSLRILGLHSNRPARSEVLLWSA